MNRPSRIEIIPDNSPEHSNTLRRPENAEWQKRVANVLNLLAKSRPMVDAMGLTTPLDDPTNPVRTLLMNTSPERLKLFLEVSFERAHQTVREADVVALKATQDAVLAALDAPEEDKRSAA